MRGPPVSKKRRRQAAAEDLEKRQLAAKAKRKKAVEKSRSAFCACSADVSCFSCLSACCKQSALNVCSRRPYPEQVPGGMLMRAASQLKQGLCCNA